MMSINTKIRLTILASIVTLAAAAPAAFALDGGTWYQGIHTDPGGTADAPAARHSGQVMNQKVASRGVLPDTGTIYGGFHTDPGGTADAPAARHSMDVMQKKIVPSNSASIALGLRGLPKY